MTELSDDPTSCPACCSTQLDPILSLRSEYDVLLCRECDLVFATPTPSPEVLRDYYQGFQYRAPLLADIERECEERQKELEGFGIASGVAEKKKFLDFGGGCGVATLAASRMGLDAYLQEVDEQAIEFATEHVGISADRVVRELEQCEMEFDVIFCDNVIEHVPDPLSFLSALYSKLAAGGCLIIKTPHARNTDSYFVPGVTLQGYFLKAKREGGGLGNAIRAHRRRWWHCDPPRHLFSFSERSLKRLAQRAEIAEFEVAYYQQSLTRYAFLTTLKKRIRSSGAAAFRKDYLSKLLFRKGMRAAMAAFLLPFRLMLDIAFVGIHATVRALSLVSPPGITLIARKS